MLHAVVVHCAWLRLLLSCAVKTKFAYAYTQEFPYRIQQILECEFFLLEAMVNESIWTLLSVMSVKFIVQHILFNCTVL